MGSPAIDAAGVSCGLTEDQRGALRPFDGDGVGGAACDLGAVEFGAPVPNSDPCTNAVPMTGCTVNGVKNQPCQGGSDEDIILGANGNDVIRGGAGNDILDGGAGKDVMVSGETKVN